MVAKLNSTERHIYRQFFFSLSQPFRPRLHSKFANTAQYMWLPGSDRNERVKAYVALSFVNTSYEL
jgi:hypothetical protein